MGSMLSVSSRQMDQHVLVLKVPMEIHSQVALATQNHVQLSILVQNHFPVFLASVESDVTLSLVVSMLLAMPLATGAFARRVLWEMEISYVCHRLFLLCVLLVVVP